ncbi:hypothetical protein I3U56_04395 [Mycobacteroides abscessus subsp. abscessus]|uniref:hypothetical protein n=1 Tax=Mycobacteroides abscessus TaxID=36809 RepID=UPI0019CFB1C4|nr:hypothetical protein [Mycobacteroides abscessus]MBN7489671.1 hypothetical protein [Mycobacteroides abscessus subsp. abscessus]
MMTAVNTFLDEHSWLPGALIALTVLFIHWRWRIRDTDSKTLDYRIEEDEPIFSSADRPNNLEVIFDNKSVLDPRITRIRFENTGKQVIKPSEIIRPFVIDRKGATILDARLTDGSEWGLASLDGRNRQSLTVEPETLNPGDWFSIRIFYDGGKGSPITVSGKIEGQTRKPELEAPKQRWPSIPPDMAFGSLSSMMILLLGVLIAVPIKFHFSGVIGWIIMIFGASGLGMYVSLISMYRDRRRKALSSGA